MRTIKLNSFFNLFSICLFSGCLLLTAVSCGDDDIVPKTKADYDPLDKGTVIVQDKPSAIEMEGEGGSKSLTFKATFPWTIKVIEAGGGEEEVPCDWIKVDKASGEAGETNIITMTIDPNESAYDTRGAKIVILSGTGAAITIPLNQNYTVKVMKASDIPDYEKYYTPNPGNEGFKEGKEGMLRSDARYSWWRSKQSEHFVVFWEPGFKDDPNAESVPEALRVNIDDLLKKAEQFYKTNIQTLKFANTGQDKSYLDKYKMEIYLLYQTEWLATGSGYDNVVGALWVNPSTCKPVGSTIAHEIGHSFQYQVYCDKLQNGASDDLRQGFRYGYGNNGEGGNGFWEQCAQWQSFQDYPTELFGYHVDVWKANYHRHFNHEWMRYASYWLQYYWAQKHGISVVGEIWKQSMFPEDPLMTYQRLYCNNSLDKLYEELYDYATRMVTYNIDVVRNYVTDAAKSYTTKLYTNDGYYQVAYAKCPGTTGFNIIPLNVTSAGNTIKANFIGLNPGSSLAADDPGNIIDGDGKTVGSATTYNNSANTSTGWRYGFVAVVNGTPQYAPMQKDKTGTVSYTIPAGTSKLYFVVMGAPSKYETHPWNDNEADDVQWPYKVKFEGTDLLGNFYIDETANPKNETFTYNITCDAATAGYDLGTINLKTNGDLQKLAQAFVMKPEVLSGNILDIANETTTEPKEGKIALGLTQKDNSLSFTYSANSGFYCTAEGNRGSWSNNDPIWFEYNKDTFVITYGHKPKASVAGQKYTIKPTLVYLKNGTQYKTSFVINLQF